MRITQPCLVFSAVFFSLTLTTAALSGCGDSNDAPDRDAGVTDASRADAGNSDAGERDAGDRDAGSSDAGASDAGVADASSGDAATADAGVDCAYVAVDEVVVSCGGDYTFVNQFVSGVGAACPAFYAFDVDGPRFDGFAATIASDPTCSSACVYEFATSVTRLYCGRRTGYETLTAIGCATLFRFPDGYYTSVEAYDASHPCT